MNGTVRHVVLVPTRSAVPPSKTCSAAGDHTDDQPLWLPRVPKAVEMVVTTPPIRVHHQGHHGTRVVFQTLNPPYSVGWRSFRPCRPGCSPLPKPGARFVTMENVYM